MCTQAGTQSDTLEAIINANLPLENGEDLLIKIDFSEASGRKDSCLESSLDWICAPQNVEIHSYTQIVYVSDHCYWKTLTDVFSSQCLCTMKLCNAAVQECTSKHAASHSICILITPQFGIKNQKKPCILMNLFLRLVLNKSVKSLALHHIPEGRTELLCDKCS